MQDSAIKELIDEEASRQEHSIELIASENVVSRDVREAVGSILTNKYAEGYPGHRFYNGCGVVDKVEALAIERCKALFGCEAANVQPHSGSQANMAVYMACLEPGDAILAMDLSAGGHLTHGSGANFSGRIYRAIPYGLDERGLIDYERVRQLALANKPKIIVCGASNYSRTIDFERFAAIAREAGALLLADISHIAGLVAAGVHPSPVGLADFVTTTTHKSLRGPRGAVVMTGSAWSRKIDASVFPGMQGGPLEHVIAGKAVCFAEALEPSFRQYARQIVRNARALCGFLMQNGVKIVSGGTDNHVFTIDLSDSEMTGRDLADALDAVGITANKNTVPNDARGPFVTSGVRIGTPAVTTRGFLEQDMLEVGEIILAVMTGSGETETLKSRVQDLCRKHPLAQFL